MCGTVNVLRQSLAFGVRRFVFASTGGALYGDSAPRPTPETAPPAPLSPYGASKAAAEVYVKSMSRLGGMRYTILRYGNVYGPGQGGAGVVGAFARAMRRRVARVHRALTAVRGLCPERFVHGAAEVGAFRTRLGTTAVLVHLRELGAEPLPALPAPVGFSPRAQTAGNRVRGFQHRVGPDPPVPGV